MTSDNAKVVIGTSVVVGMLWFLFVSFVLLAVGAAYLSPVFWVSLAAFAGVLILSTVSAGGKKTARIWEHPINLGPRQGMLIGITMFVMLVASVVVLYLPLPSSTKGELVRGVVTGLLLGAAAGITYMQFAFRNPRPRFCERCCRTTWHLKVESEYRCNVCGTANRSERNGDSGRSMSQEKDEAYLRRNVPNRRGPPKVVEVTRRNWHMTLILVVLMWAIMIGFFGFLEGVELAVVLAVVAGLVIVLFYWLGWYFGR